MSIHTPKSLPTQLFELKEMVLKLTNRLEMLEMAFGGIDGLDKFLAQQQSMAKNLKSIDVVEPVVLRQDEFHESQRIKENLTRYLKYCNQYSLDAESYFERRHNNRLGSSTAKLRDLEDVNKYILSTVEYVSKCCAKQQPHKIVSEDIKDTVDMIVSRNRKILYDNLSVNVNSRHPVKHTLSVMIDSLQDIKNKLIA